MLNSTATLGVDVGGTRIKWVRWIAGAGIAEQGQLPTPRTGPAGVVEAIGALAGGQQCDAVGVGVPGHLTDDGRGTRMIPNLPGEWAGLRLADQVEERIGHPVVLTNDARAFARAELDHGAARDLANVLFVTLGTGIGGALALNGKILRSRGDAVGELGHMICRPGGRRCGCGAIGCLETVAGGSALVTCARALGSAAETPDDVVRLAESTDGPERGVLLDAAQALGLVLGNVLAYTGVNTVVIGGGVASAFDAMRERVQLALAERSGLIGTAIIRMAELGPIAGALGAAFEAIEYADARLTLPAPGGT
ncbi:ROK family protein [Planosporangium thailandense]|uniref:ROK family protein n=1 Tax=Planosporangium thailandense TaxID=765197 RepID=A0ABX0Y3F6_9ACTN|nr:ROK family protein [Planosporangium thailandense]